MKNVEEDGLRAGQNALYIKASNKHSTLPDPEGPDHAVNACIHSN